MYTEKRELTSKEKKLFEQATRERILSHFEETYPNEEDKDTFSRRNGLKPELLNLFMEGEKYVTARFILMKEYLLKHHKWNIQSKDYVSFLYDYKIVKNWEGARQGIIEQAQSNQKKIIVVLDADNLSSSLDFSFFDNNQDILHVCAVFANRTVNDATIGYESKDWLSIVYSHTNTKDASDTCISLLLGSLQTSLSFFFPEGGHHIILITKDHFADELISQLREVGRGCSVAKSMRELPSMIGSIKNGTLSKNEKTLSVIPKMSSAINIIKILDNPKSDDLRQFFDISWIGSGKSQNQFCKSNSLDSTNFSKHLNKKKYNHACKTALEKYYPLGEGSTEKESRFLLNIGGQLSNISLLHDINGNSIRIFLQDSDLTTAHFYNPLIRRNERIMYHEWIDQDGFYRIIFSSIDKEQDKSLFIELGEAIVTIPLLMKYEKNTPIDLELRLVDGSVDVSMKSHSSQCNPLCYSYFGFDHWTPQTYIEQSKILHSFLDENLNIIEQYTLTSRFVPFSTPITNPAQRFNQSGCIDLSTIENVNDLISLQCSIKEEGDKYRISTIGSMRNPFIDKIYISDAVAEYIKKRGGSPSLTDCLIENIPQFINGAWVVHCKVI